MLLQKHQMQPWLFVVPMILQLQGLHEHHHQHDQSPAESLRKGDIGLQLNYRKQNPLQQRVTAYLDQQAAISEDPGDSINRAGAQVQAVGIWGPPVHLHCVLATCRSTLLYVIHTYCVVAPAGLCFLM